MTKKCSIASCIIQVERGKEGITVDIIKMGRKWEINTRADYDKAMETLDGNEFCAKMSDDYYYYQRELAEVAKQRAEVNALAKAKGII